MGPARLGTSPKARTSLYILRVENDGRVHIATILLTFYQWFSTYRLRWARRPAAKLNT